jgi:hypothetical protein
VSDIIRDTCSGTRVDPEHLFKVSERRFFIVFILRLYHATGFVSNITKARLLHDVEICCNSLSPYISKFLVRGKLMVDIATDAAKDSMDDEKDATAAQKRGGRDRASALPAEQRAEIAKSGAAARWREKSGA